MSGQTFSAGVPPTGAELTAIQYQNEVNISNIAVTSGTDTTTSSSYVNMAGSGSVTSVSFTKVLSVTNIKVSMAVGWENASNTSLVKFGVLVDGTDYDVCQSILNATLTIGFAAGDVIITGVAAGTYTIQGRWKRAGGTGTPSRSVNEWFSMTVAECT